MKAKCMDRMGMLQNLPSFEVVSSPVLFLGIVKCRKKRSTLHVKKRDWELG